MTIQQAVVTVRPATPEDKSAIAAIFGRAFDDYQHGLGVDAAALGRLWEDSLAARVASTLVATDVDGRVVGFVVFIKPGEKESYGTGEQQRRRFGKWRHEIGRSAFWRLPAFFIPLGFAYARRSQKKDELYVSLIAVDPEVQGRGVGQALLGAVEAVAREAEAAAILLHTASTNKRAQASYARFGFELVCTVRAPWIGPARIPAYLALRKSLRPDPTPVLDGVNS